MKQPFEHAVTLHGATVLRVCRAVLGPGHDADDAWSETFLSALQAWPDLDEDANVEAWLVRIAGRKAIDVTRGRMRRAIPSDQLPERESTLGVPETVDREIAHAEMWQAVAQLPEKQRLAVAYHYLGGLAHTETAELIGATPAAVRRAASDGIQALRRRFSTSDAQLAKGAQR